MFLFYYFCMTCVHRWLYAFRCSGVSRIARGIWSCRWRVSQSFDSTFLRNFHRTFSCWFWLSFLWTNEVVSIIKLPFFSGSYQIWCSRPRMLQTFRCTKSDWFLGFPITPYTTCYNYARLPCLSFFSCSGSDWIHDRLSYYLVVVDWKSNSGWFHASPAV